MSCSRHADLEKLLQREEYRDFKPYTGDETDFMGQTQGEYIAKIRREQGEEYYQQNKDWLWSSLAWEMYLDVAR